MKTISKFAALLCALAMLASLSSCFGKSRLVGTWTSSSSVLGMEVSTSYTFEKDGTGRMSTVLGIDVPFTYDVSGGSLFITSSVLGTQSTVEYSYKISGNTLYLTSDGETLALTKK